MGERGSDIGMALRGYRIRAGINQAVMARTLGVSQSQVSRWESGRDRPRARNAEAIKALVWGRSDPVLAGLIHYVRGAAAPLVLFDSDLRILAASRFLRGSGGPLALFGWLFDPAVNPEYRSLKAQLDAMARRSAAGMAFEIPFSHEARPWACYGRLTFYRIEPELYALGELSFVRDEQLRVTVLGVRAQPAAPVEPSPDRTRSLAR